MSDLDALLAGIVADPANAVRWLVMADWLEDHGQPERAELVRVHRELLRTCTDPDAHPERPQLHARMMELMRAGVQPCLPQKTLTLSGGVELRMSFIPPGSFLMGSPAMEANRHEEEALHLVTLTEGYWLSQTVVTQQQWRALSWYNPSRVQGGTLPVETVSWDEANALCERMNSRTRIAARLPTEAEWEYAARSGTSTAFYWGRELNGAQANCNGNHPYGMLATGPRLRETSQVQSYAGEYPHPWGLADLIGNVWEWCADWHNRGYYQVSMTENPPGPVDGSNRVVRGGGWDTYAEYCRVAFRNRYTPYVRNDNVGFRLAADVDTCD